MSFPESVYTQFFTLNPIFIVSGPSLAFPEQKNSKKKNMISVPITWGEFEGACPLKLTQGGVRGGAAAPPARGTQNRSPDNIIVFSSHFTFYFPL